jgi:hypothetical protein
MGAAQSVIDEQALFRIRFTRARGFAALFERPENTYQWSGYGTLRVEPRGIQFEATRRRVMGLRRAASRFVAGREIDNVYREGDGVRVEFRDDAQQNVLNFWAEDSAAAASIVEQFPTVRTVEVEEPPRRAARPAKHVLRMDLLGMALAALLVLAAGAWLIVSVVKHATSAVSTALSSDDEDALVSSVQGIRPSAVEIPSIDAGAAGSVEAAAPVISAGELKVMQQDFARFAGRSDALRAQFDSAFKALLDGSLSQPDFADGVERWLIPRWVSTEKTLSETPYAAGTQREAFRASLMDISNSWRTGLESYVSGLREQQSSQVHRAFAYIGAAEESQLEAQELVTR